MVTDVSADRGHGQPVWLQTGRGGRRTAAAPPARTDPGRLARGSGQLQLTAAQSVQWHD